MALIRKIFFAFIVFLSLKNVICEESDTKIETVEATTLKLDEDELEPSESKDGKLDIIKKIKKINPDGSYTIGYEADDGSFKIESRDVLGNIKGTYGFVDDEGQVKRVSYSSSNASDIFTKHEPVNQPELPIQSVVQRIPKNDKSFTTKKPSTYSTYSSTTQSTPTTTPNSVIQSIARRRASSTTIKPNYNNIESIRTTLKPNPVIYSSGSPRVLLQRPSLASTGSTKTRIVENKSEGQIIRPEVVSEKPTEHTIFRNLPVKTFDDDKPINEEASEVRNNILRRQLPHDIKGGTFNAKEHVYSLQQSFGNNDLSDIYNNGATATSRPLFTTSRPIRILPIIASTAASDSVAVQRPVVKYAINNQKNYLQEVETNTAEYSRPIEEISTSTEASSTPTNIPVVQIPPNSAGTQEPLVAIRHPFQQGAILVPLSQLQGRILPIDSMQEVQEARRHYVSHRQNVPQTTSTPSVEIERQNVQKLPSLRPLPVHVDENGFIREMPQNVPTPYPLPVPITPIPVQLRPLPVTPAPVRYEGNEIDTDIESIQPPVSTKDFQKLLNQLIMRQKKLERVSAITSSKRHSEYYQPQPVQYQRVLQNQPQQYFVQRVVPQNLRYNAQPQEIDQPQQRSSIRQYVSINPQEVERRERYNYQYHREIENEDYQPRRVAASYERQQPAYIPNRRLLHSRTSRQNQATPVYRENSEASETEEYLPPEVREMLLLRMLKLAMNPALPLDDEDEAQQLATATTPQYKRAPVRNVEILGEEEEEVEMPKKRYGGRTKRYKEEDMEYME